MTIKSKIPLSTEHTTIPPWPKIVDLNPTGKCNLRCTFCWGPDHEIPDGLNTEGWKNVMDFFADRGTEAIVFTGGEPLVRRDIVDLIEYAKRKKGMRVTLSTNALLLARYADAVLLNVDWLGLPLDGSDQAMNARMRIGNPKSYEAVLGALDMVARDYPEINISVRTVVSKLNAKDVPDIGTVLSDKVFKQWILYQFAPVSIGAIHEQEHIIDRETFDDVVEQVRHRHPQLPSVAYPNSGRSGRYVFVGPEGNIFGVDDMGNYQVTGNFLRDSVEELERSVVKVFDPEANALHQNSIHSYQDNT